MSQGNVALIQGLYDAFAAGNVPAVLGAMHPEVIWNEAESNPLADGNPYKGPQAVLDGVFMRLGEDYEDFTVATEQFLDAGEAVVMLGRYRAKGRRTGKSLDAQAVHVWWLSDGKVLRFQQYADTAQLVEVTGR